MPHPIERGNRRRSRFDRRPRASHWLERWYLYLRKTFMQLPKGKKIYFASDNHLGAPTAEESAPRERIFVAWLDHIKADAGALFLLGDLFDFWFEYKTVVPKGFVRVLGKLAELADAAYPYTSLWETTTCGCSIIWKKK